MEEAQGVSCTGSSGAQHKTHFTCRECLESSVKSAPIGTIAKGIPCPGCVADVRFRPLTDASRKVVPTLPLRDLARLLSESAFRQVALAMSNTPVVKESSLHLSRAQRSVARLKERLQEIELFRCTACQQAVWRKEPTQCIVMQCSCGVLLCFACSETFPDSRVGHAHQCSALKPLLPVTETMLFPSDSTVAKAHNSWRQVEAIRAWRALITVEERNEAKKDATVMELLKQYGVSEAFAR